MKFTFTVFGMSRAQAEELLNIIQHVVTLLGLTMRGGFRDQEKR